MLVGRLQNFRPRVRSVPSVSSGRVFQLKKKKFHFAFHFFFPREGSIVTIQSDSLLVFQAPVAQVVIILLGFRVSYASRASRGPRAFVGQS